MPIVTFESKQELLSVIISSSTRNVELLNKSTQKTWKTGAWCLYNTQVVMEFAKKLAILPF